jgi:hypothetical protein
LHTMFHDQGKDVHSSYTADLERIQEVEKGTPGRFRFCLTFRDSETREDAQVSENLQQEPVGLFSCPIYAELSRKMRQNPISDIMLITS